MDLYCLKETPKEEVTCSSITNILKFFLLFSALPTTLHMDASFPHKSCCFSTLHFQPHTHPERPLTLLPHLLFVMYVTLAPRQCLVFTNCAAADTHAPCVLCCLLHWMHFFLPPKLQGQRGLVLCLHSLREFHPAGALRQVRG